MENKLKDELLWKKGINKNEFYTNRINNHCQPWIDDPNKKDPSVECLQAIYDSNGCLSAKQDKTDFTKAHNFKTLYLDSQWYFVRGCTETGLRDIGNFKNTATNMKKNMEKMEKNMEKNMEDELNTAIKVSRNKIMGDESNIELKVINNILKIKDKAKEKIVLDGEDIIDGFSATKTSEDTKKYLNFNQYLIEISKGYNEAIRTDISRTKADAILHEDYNSFKKDGTVANIIGEQNIEEFENQLKQLTGVDVNKPIDVPEGFDNGVSYDENGNLREHKGRSGACYLITALTKAKLLSIGQVYQLRKLMLEAFKVESNRPFFSFYYDNFGPIADMLVKENRLTEILPNMLKCIDLSKNGQFDLAFEQYLLTAKQAYKICKDIGMDTKDLEDKFEKLDGNIDVLPEPNNLFVENGFREAIKSC